MTAEVVDTPITEATFLSELAAVVAEAPETIYRAPTHQSEDPGDCFYVHTDALSGAPVESGCGIGRVLHRLGVDLGTLQEHEGERADQVLALLLPQLGATVRLQARSFQYHQDLGASWRDAYEIAKAKAEASG